MLCYAWENTLKQDDDKLLGEEAFDNIYNLLSAILIQGVTQLVKGGFVRDYINYSESLPLVRGRININSTLKEQSLIKRQIVCDYDQFSENIIMNQIIKSTMKSLFISPYVSKKYKIKFKMLLRNFVSIDGIDLRQVSWNRIRYNRNNKRYRLIINICRLINTGLIANEEQGSNKFPSFIKDDAMAKLYEKFVLNFYKHELDNVKIYSPLINWQLDEKSDSSFLPVMKTDIVLEKKNKMLIIDTKYYRKTLLRSYYGQNKRLFSNNLYQIFSYVKNMEYEGEVSGMLLYPTVNYDLDKRYIMSGNNIYVKTVNLGLEFKYIRETLLDIANIIVLDET